MTITTYSGLKDAVGRWLRGTTSDTTITGSFDDFLSLHEHRMYYGQSAVAEIGLPPCEPLRIREMETVNASFALSATVAQPTGFLELIEAALNNPLGPLRVEHEGVIAAYGEQTTGTPEIIALSGTNFRVWPTPSGQTATLRYFRKLDTPTSGGTVNWIVTNAPMVYLHGLLLEAAIRTQDVDSAKLYHALYSSAVRALNENRSRELAYATNVRLRIRGRTP